jgi:hypothetical protein
VLKSLLSTIIIFLILIPSVSAHEIDDIHSLKINGVFTKKYLHVDLSTDAFFVPRDQAPDVYLINQPLNLEIVPQTLPFLTKFDALQLDFSIDYGDGRSDTGLKQNISYPRPGSYIINIYAGPKGHSHPQLVHSTLINIVPDKNYPLPQAVIHLYGKEIKQPIDSQQISFNQQLSLDASNKNSSGPNEYLWDLGDKHSANTSKLTHQYSQDHYRAMVVIQIKDSNGFISHAAIELLRKDNPISIPGQKKSLFSPPNIIVATIVIIITVILIALLRRFKKG